MKYSFLNIHVDYNGQFIYSEAHSFILEFFLYEKQENIYKQRCLCIYTGRVSIQFIGSETYFVPEIDSL